MIVKIDVNRKKSPVADAPRRLAMIHVMTNAAAALTMMPRSVIADSRLIDLCRSSQGELGLRAEARAREHSRDQHEDETLGGAQSVEPDRRCRGDE